MEAKSAEAARLEGAMERYGLAVRDARNVVALSGQRASVAFGTYGQQLGAVEEMVAELTGLLAARSEDRTSLWKAGWGFKGRLRVGVLEDPCLQAVRPHLRP